MNDKEGGRLVLISGCSGGGKSTLLAALAGRGFATVEEPGRRVVRAELALGGVEGGGRALPWVDPEGFLRRALALAAEDHARAGAGPPGWVFFDRGLIDAAAGLARATGRPLAHWLPAGQRYHPLVFLAPPWPAIHSQDEERRHGLDEAVAEYEHLSAVFPALGYRVALLPRVDVAARADFVLATLAGG